MTDNNDHMKENFHEIWNLTQFVCLSVQMLSGVSETTEDKAHQLEIPCCPLLEQENIFVPQPVKFLSEDLLCGNCTCHNYATYRDINLHLIILKDDVSLCHILIFTALSQRMVNTEMPHIFLRVKILPVLDQAFFNPFKVLYPVWKTWLLFQPIWADTNTSKEENFYQILTITCWKFWTQIIIFMQFPSCIIIPKCVLSKPSSEVMRISLKSEFW